jgi:G:T/U-mismatch repair DNA glycosylase
METHPIPLGFIPNNIYRLVVGTFPPKVEYETKGNSFFFYASSRNHFWNRVDNIFESTNNYKKLKHTLKSKNETMSDNKVRKEKFCALNGIGFLDVFTVINRKQENSTKDSDLISIETVFQNGTFLKVIKETDLKYVYCTYSLAYQTLKNWLSSIRGIQGIVNEKYSANGEKIKALVDGKEFDVVLLFPATRSGQKGEAKDFQYRYFLFPDQCI